MDVWDLSNTGTSVDERTPAAAWGIVGASVLFLPAAVSSIITPSPKIASLDVCFLTPGPLCAQVPSLLGAHFLVPAWGAVAVLSFLAIATYLAFSVMAPELQRRLEKSRLDRYFRYNMVRSFAFYSNR